MLACGVVWNQPEKVKWSCPLFYLLKRLCVYRRRSCFSVYLLKCIARTVGFLSPVLHASPTACIPLFYPLLFPALLNPTPPLAGTPVCPTPFPGWWEELCSRFCLSPFSATCQGLCPHSSMAHFPPTVIPVDLSMPGTPWAPGFSAVTGKRLFDPLAVTAVTITAAGLRTRYRGYNVNPTFLFCLIPH